MTRPARNEAVRSVPVPVPALAVAVAAIALAAASCGGTGTPEPPPQVDVGEDGDRSPTASPGRRSAKPRKVDPRTDGFDVGFGEFAVTLEADAIRPGPVTFVVRNGGKLVHGFEMESEGPERDNSGPGGGGDDDGFKIETGAIQPGDSLRVRMDLEPGVYKIECWVDGHDDLGMEALIEVRADAPLIRRKPAGAPGAVAIERFAFDPETLQVDAGTKVTWTNRDPTPHTVTARDDSFDSGNLGEGKKFSTTLREPGRYRYVCAIHPSMAGTITVR